MFTVRVDEPDPRFGTMLLEQFAARSMIHLLPSPEEGLLSATRWAPPAQLISK